MPDVLSVPLVPRPEYLYLARSEYDSLDKKA